MVDLEFKDSASGVTDSSLSATLSTLTPYLKILDHQIQVRNETAPEASLLLPDDPAGIAASLKMAIRLGNQLKVVLLVGIGGSSLGARAVYEALTGTMANISPTRWPKLLCLESLDPATFEDTLAYITETITKPEDLAICYISKSGTTTETLTNFETVLALLAQRFGSAVNERVVIISDPGNPLAQKARQNNFNFIEHPLAVGGRFAVLSVVGLLPLALLGFDLKNLLQGALTMRQRCLLAAPTNPALNFATHLYFHRLQGRRIHNMFLFNPQLETLGMWYRQLLAESTGKATREDGVKVYEGMLPIVSIGSNDLHSMAQEYWDGPDQIFTSFIYSPRQELKVAAPDNFITGQSRSAGKQFHQVMSAIFEATKKTYKARNLPFDEFYLDQINEHTLGQFLQLNMTAIILLAKLLNVNAFNQPGVQGYKQLTQEILN